MNKFTLAALTIVLATTGAAHAGELVPYGAESIELGSIRGVTYFTGEQGGYRVITTLADGEAGLPVRFEATLASDQRLTISVPGKFGEPGKVLEISRTGDHLVVSNPELVAADTKPAAVDIMPVSDK